MPNTPTFGWPYPAGTDRVMDGDNAMGDLALEIESVVAATLQALQPGRAIASSLLTLTTADQIIPGLTRSITVSSSSNVLAIVAFDFVFASGADVGNCTGRCYLDGAARGGTASGRAGSTAGANQRHSTVGMWVIPLPSAGTYVVDARALKDNAAGTAQAGGFMGTIVVPTSTGFPLGG